MHFVHTFSIMRAQGVRLNAIKQVRNYEKIVYIKSIFENGSGRMHISHPTPLYPPLEATETIKRVWHISECGIFHKKGGHWAMAPLFDSAF